MSTMTLDPGHFIKINLLANWTGEMQITFQGPLAKQVDTTGPIVSPPTGAQVNSCDAAGATVTVKLTLPGMYQVDPGFSLAQLCPAPSPIANLQHADASVETVLLAGVKKKSKRFDFDKMPGEKAQIIVVLTDSGGGGPTPGKDEDKDKDKDKDEDKDLEREKDD